MLITEKMMKLARNLLGWKRAQVGRRVLLEHLATEVRLEWVKFKMRFFDRALVVDCLKKSKWNLILATTIDALSILKRITWSLIMIAFHCHRKYS
ncbi:hypothetical protein GR28A_00100 [Vibrio phage vB_VcorM_GR28A]|nr:hypothetical protein GR28A_00100 [Vibrio phage vB_VcorM_GR28A]